MTQCSGNRYAYIYVKQELPINNLSTFQSFDKLSEFYKDRFLICAESIQDVGDIGTGKPLNFFLFLSLREVCCFNISSSPIVTSINTNSLGVTHCFSLHLLISVHLVNSKFVKLSFFLLCPSNFNSKSQICPYDNAYLIKF